MKVYMHPNKVWEYAYKNIALLRTKIIVIAECEIAGRTIEMTVDNSHLEVQTCQSTNGKDEVVDTEIVLNMHDCRTAIMRMLLRYFGISPDEWVALLYSTAEEWGQDGYYIPDYSGFENETPPTEAELQQEREDSIYEREDDLEMAVCDFLMAVMQLPNHAKVHQVFDAEVLYEILDDLLQVLSEKHEIKIYRPTFIGDESTGDDIYVEYPYEISEEMGDAE